MYETLYGKPLGEWAEIKLLSERYFDGDLTLVAKHIEIGEDSTVGHLIKINRELKLKLKKIEEILSC